MMEPLSKNDELKLKYEKGSKLEDQFDEIRDKRTRFKAEGGRS